MLADLAHVLAKDFEVLIQEAGIAERGAFVVNPEGRVVSYEGTVLEPIRKKQFGLNRKSHYIIFRFLLQ